jgi:hypothetical protein
MKVVKLVGGRDKYITCTPSKTYVKGKRYKVSNDIYDYLISVRDESGRAYFIDGSEAKVVDKVLSQKDSDKKPAEIKKEKTVSVN